MSLPAKLLLWISIITMVVASGLWLAGGQKQEYSASIEIKASPSEVFAFLTEPEKQKSWITGLTHVEPLESNSDENGSPRRTTTTRVISVGGREFQFDDQVIRFEPNESLTVRSSNGDQIVTSIYLLEPKDSQTHLTYRVIKLNRGMMRVLAPLRRDRTQEQLDEEIRKLKQLAESDH